MNSAARTNPSARAPVAAMRRFDAALVPHGPATRVTDLTNELALSGAPVASFPRLSWVGDEYVVSFDAVGQYYVKSVCD